MEADYRVHLANPTAMQQYSSLKYTDDHSDACWFAKDKRFRTLKRDTHARLEAVKAAIVGTQWEAALCQLVNPLRIRSIIFEENGCVTAATARSRNRNTYHLAVLSGHFLILQGHKPA